MKTFRRFALAATVATYFLIYVGGLVRVSGAGLGCPDWPTCFGRWIPPTAVSQLPPDIDPAQFNFALAWIEWVNRLIGIMVGLFIAVTAIWALAAFRRRPRIVWPAVLAAVLVAYQGWQGGRMIAAQLEPFLVSIHMGLAFIIVCLMVYVTQQAYYLEKSIEPAASRAGGFRPWIFVLVVISIGQVFMGTQMRTALERAAEQFPLLPQSHWLAQAGAINAVHTILGVFVTLVAWRVGAGILRRLPSASGLSGQVAWALIVLATMQVILGALLILAGVPDLVQLFHLLLSSLFVGMLVMLLTALRYEGGAA